MPRFARLLPLLPLLTAACAFDVAVNEGAVIACDSDEDCPAPASCAGVLGRCDLNPIPIDIDGLTVDPPVARAGTTLTLRFEVEALVHELPDVAPTWPGVLQPAEGTDIAAGVFVYTYDVVGDEPDDDVQGVSVDVVGDGGRNASAVAPVRFDFAPPVATVELVGDALVEPVTHGGRVSLLVRGLADDEVVSRVALVAGGAPIELDLQDLTTVRLGFDVEAALTLPSPLDAAVVDAGAFRVQVEVSDPAGNTQPLETDAVSVDVLPPVAVLSIPDPIGTPEVELGFANLDARFFELGGDVVSPLGRIPAAPSVTARLTSTPGPKTITVRLLDGAGNAASLVGQTTLLDGVFVTVDLVAPDGRTAARPGETVTISGVAAVGATVTDTLAFVGDPGTPVPVTAAVDAGGLLGGTLQAPAGLEGELTVAITVTRDDESATSDAHMDVDNTPPVLTLSYAEGAAGASADATLIVGTDDDVEALTFDSGDVLAVRRGGAIVGLNTEVAPAESFNVSFTREDGTKTLSLTARDRAGHTTNASVTFIVDASLLDANPSLNLARVAPGALLTVGGTATVGSTLSSARALYGDDCYEQALPNVTVGANGTISGSFTVLEGPLPNGVIDCADDVVVEVIVADGAATSDGINSRSAATMVDDAPPAGGPPLFLGASVETGGGGAVTRVTGISISVSATDGAGAGTVTVVGASSDVVGANIDTPIPMIGGGQNLAVTVGLTLTSGDGPKTVTVIVTDSLGNASEPRAATITLDTLPPSAATLSAIRVLESAPAGNRFNPAILDAQNKVEITGLPGAASGAATVQLESVIAIQVVPVAPDGSFGPATLNTNPQHSYNIRVFDDAGNSATITATLPKATGVSYTPALPSRDAPVGVELTITGGFSAASLQIADNDAAPAEGPANFIYTPTGAEPELPALTVARVQMSPSLGTFAAGSASTQASTVSFDFTDPVVINTLPGGLATWDGLPAIQGTAVDNGTLLAVHVSIREGSTGLFWDPNLNAFASVEERLGIATGLASWTFPGVVYNGGAYTVRVFAVDGAGNLGPGLSNTFIWDDGDGTPGRFTALATAPQRVELAWTAPQFGVDEYVLFWEVTAGVGDDPPVADQGEPPLTLDRDDTSFVVTGLPRENSYTFTLEGRRGAEKFPATTNAPSLAFGDTLGSIPPVLDLAAEPGLAVLGTLNGDIAVSDNNGLTWNVLGAKTPDAAFVDVNGGRAVIVASTGQVAVYDHGQGSFEAKASSGISNVGAVGFDGEDGILVASADQDQVSRSLNLGTSFVGLPTTLGLRIKRITHPAGSNRMLVVGGDLAGGHVSFAPGGLGTLVQVFAPPGELLVAGVAHGSDSVLLVCGNLLYRSGDDGQSFDPVGMPVEAPCQALDMDRDTAVIGVTRDPGADLLESGDAGASWALIGTSTAPLDDLSVTENRELCAVYRTNDVFCRLGNAPLRIYPDERAGRRHTRVNVIGERVIVTGSDIGDGYVSQYGP